MKKEATPSNQVESRAPARPFRESHATAPATLRESMTVQRGQCERVEDALRRTEERTHAILNAIPDLMFLMTLDGVYEDYHAPDPSALFLPPHRFLGRHMRDVLPPHLADRFLALFQQVPETGEPLLVEYELTVQGKCRFFEARLVRLDSHILSIVRDVTDLRSAERELKRRDAEVRFLAGRILHDQDDERKRIARELHDSLSQKLAALSTMMRKLRDEAPELRACFDAIGRELAQAAAEVRDFSHELHPSVLDFAGILAAIRAYAQEFENRAGLAVTLQLPEELTVDPHLSLCIYRVVQEALRNSEKHSNAKQAGIIMRVSEDSVQLSIEDDGVGFDLAAARASGGLGIVSIEERVRLLHGSVEINAVPDRGTSILVTLPLSAG